MAEAVEVIDPDPYGEDVDFAPLGEDGKADINDDDLEPLLDNKEVGGKNWGERIKGLFSRRGTDISDRELGRYERLENEGDGAYRSRLKQEIEEFEMRKLRERERKMASAAEEVEKKYPKWDPKKKVGKAKTVLVGEDEAGNVVVKLGKENSKSYFLDEPEKSPPTLEEALGPTSEAVRAHNEELITENERTIERNEEERKRLEESNDPNDRERVREIRRENEELERANERINGENEAILERTSLKDRIKEIFKKAGGITVASVLAATLVVVGFILSKLKAGLSAMGRGLKNLGKKMGALLPGLIGSILSFLFKAAGEVVKFVAKNAWLLILAVVVYVVEEYKNKKKR